MTDGGSNADLNSELFFSTRTVTTNGYNVAKMVVATSSFHNLLFTCLISGSLS